LQTKPSARKGWSVAAEGEMSTLFQVQKSVSAAQASKQAKTLYRHWIRSVPWVLRTYEIDDITLGEARGKKCP